jgi:hypothetical protein
LDEDGWEEGGGCDKNSWFDELRVEGRREEEGEGEGKQYNINAHAHPSE